MFYWIETFDWVDFLSKHGEQITIPFNQREYKWTPETIKEFFDTIAEHLDEKNKFFVFPIIVSVPEEGVLFKKNIYVVDGQQRLTTLTLTLAALLLNHKEKILNTSLKEKIETLLRNLNINKEIKNLNVEDIQCFFSKVINIEFAKGQNLYKEFIDSLSENLENKEMTVSDFLLNENPYKINFEFINDLLKEKDVNFIEKLLKMSFVVNYCNIDKINFVFEHFNTNGNTMSTREMFKNRIFLQFYNKSELEKLDRIYEELENTIVDIYDILFKDNNKKKNISRFKKLDENFEKFFVFYLNFFTNIEFEKFEITKKEIKSILDNLFKSNSDFNNIQNLLKTYLNILKTIKKILLLFDNNNKYKNLIYYITIGKEDNIRILTYYFPIFYFIEKEEDRIKVIEELNNYISYKLIESKTSISRIISAFNEKWYMKLWKEKNIDIDNIINEIRKRYNKINLKLLYHEDMDIQNAKELLMFSIINNKEIVKKLGDIDIYKFINFSKQNITLEHILPQNLINNNEYLKKHEKYLIEIKEEINNSLINSLKNFTILTRRGNSKLKDDMPNQKFKKFLDTELNLIKLLEPDLYEEIMNSSIYKKEFLEKIFELNKKLLINSGLKIFN